MAATAPAGPPAAQLLLPALNDVFDIATTRIATLETHPPKAVYLALALLALLAAALAGMSAPSSEPAWHRKIIFAGAITITVYLTLEIEHARLGFINVAGVDHFIEEARWFRVRAASWTRHHNECSGGRGRQRIRTSACRSSGVAV